MKKKKWDFTHAAVAIAVVTILFVTFSSYLPAFTNHDYHRPATARMTSCPDGHPVGMISNGNLERTYDANYNDTVTFAGVSNSASQTACMTFDFFVKGSVADFYYTSSGQQPITIMVLNVRSLEWDTYSLTTPNERSTRMLRLSRDHIGFLGRLQVAVRLSAPSMGNQLYDIYIGAA